MLNLSRSLNSSRTWMPLSLSRYSSSSSPSPLFDKILIANRGEIACRVIRTARRLGIRTVAVYSDIDENSMHTSMADEAYNIGEAPAKESYLCGDRILDVARRSGAQAIHPGYGFLSENAGFAKQCQANQVEFIGPPVGAIEAMGSKSASKEIMLGAKVPCVPGYHGEDQSVEHLLGVAESIKYPVLLKAVLGGGGKGMRIVHNKSEMQDAILSAKREAQSSFGDERLLIEKFLVKPRHVEFQVFADKFGNCVHLFERDCSVQRRYQKVLEEAPGPGMSVEQRNEMGAKAVAAAKAVGYVGAGTVEFIVDQDGSYYFMEMNTRLQVEHPVTELITGVDLVQWQLEVAAGRELPKTQEELTHKGHAFEARIYAENPDNDFLPGTGKLVHLKPPADSKHVRVETGVREGDDVSIYYDPMIAKLCVWDEDRTSALRQLRVALGQYQIAGLNTNVSFLRTIASHPGFIEGQVSTDFIPEYKDDLLPEKQPASRKQVVLAAISVILSKHNANNEAAFYSHDPQSPWNANDAFRLNHVASKTVKITDDGTEVPVTISYIQGDIYQAEIEGVKRIVSGSLGEDGRLDVVYRDQKVQAQVVTHTDGSVTKISLFCDDGEQFTLEHHEKDYENSGADQGSLVSPMPGKVVKVMAAVGDVVTKGQPLLILEAMKMEHTIKAPSDGVVSAISHNVGDLVSEKTVLASIDAKEE